MIQFILKPRKEEVAAVGRRGNITCCYSSESAPAEKQQTHTGWSRSSTVWRGGTRLEVSPLLIISFSSGTQWRGVGEAGVTFPTSVAAVVESEIMEIV